MKMTSLEIKEQKIRKKLFGYDPAEVEIMRELACASLEDAARKITELRADVDRMGARVKEHERIENTLKDTVTTAHKMYEDLKGSAGKEAELIVAEARLHADELQSQATERTREMLAEITALKKQRIELEISINAVLDYHANILELGAEESRKADEELEKLRFLKK